MAGLLLTRPRPASERFAARLPDQVTNRIRTVVSPLIDIQPRPGPIEIDSFAGIVFSSSNGVGCAAQLLQHRDVQSYCIGKATTAAAREAGWSATCSGSNADELVERLLALRPAAPLLHLRGAHGRGGIAARLSAGGVACSDHVVYDQVLLDFSEEALTLLSGSEPLIAPVFSPRTARQFAKLCPKSANLYFVALSEAVAEPLKALNYNHLSVCSEPNAQSMTDEIAKIIEVAQ